MIFLKRRWFLFLLFPIFTSAQITKPWLDYKFPSIIADNRLWIGTPGGLYQYHYEDDSWSLYGMHNGLPGNDIQILRWDDEYLWLATPEGLGQGDIRLNKWLIFNRENGLPSNTIFSIEFQGDYVWIGTDRGAARYDKLIQEWEIFDGSSGLPDTTIFDIAVQKDLVYFGTGKGLAEYDVNFEKWRYFTKAEGLPSDTIRYIYQTTENFWLFTPAGPCQFNKQLYTTLSFLSDPRLQYDEIRTLHAENNRLWAATQSDVLIYDPNSNAWREYQESTSLPSTIVNDMSISQESSWFATEAGVAQLNEQTKTWRYYDLTHGLSAERFDRVSTFRGRVFFINRETIDYYKPDENRWYNHPLKSAVTQKKGQYPMLSLDREQGSYLQMSDNLQLSLNGTRITSIIKSKDQLALNTGIRKSTWESGNRLDVKGQIRLSEDRTVNGFYNNVDENQVMYGVRYRGNREDWIQEINWGDLRFEKGRHEIATSTGLFGGSFRVEAGPKTEQYKRSLLSVKGFSGERTTGTEIEFLTGNVKSGQMTKRDVDFTRRRFFTLEPSEVPKSFKAGRETIYMDDGSEATNDKNTQVITLAGISGSFDKLVPFMDYLIDNGMIQILRSVPETATLIIDIPEGSVSGQYILQHEGYTTERMNVYTLGVKEIMPYNFRFSIIDTLGHSHDLHEFGLDENHDGFIDPERIDYHQGILNFNKKQPFPDPVYQDPQVSCFRMDYTFETELSFFILSHDSLVRGSEILTIDGKLLTPGQDYVLDYTVGSLIIIKEGILSEDSEIQIEYEYYKNSNEQFHLMGLGYGPSDNLLIEAAGYVFDDGIGARYEQTRGMTVFSELKGQIKSWDFKLTPEISRTRSGGFEGNRYYVRSDISTEKCRLYGLIEHIDPEHRSLLTKKFQLGNLHRQINTGFTFYPIGGLDIIGQWQRQQAQADEAGYQNLEENKIGKILFSRTRIPALSITFRDQWLDTDYKAIKKQTFKGEFEYILPVQVLEKLSLQSMRLYGVWRHSQEKNDWKEEKLEDAKLYDNVYFRMDVSPAGRIQLNGYYQGRQTRSADSDFKSSRLLNQHQKIFMDAIMDRIQGLNMNIRYQGEIVEYASFSNSPARQFTLNRRLESTVRIFPGQWAAPLSPFTFQISFQPYRQSTLRNINRSLTWTEKFWSSTELNTPTSSTDNDLVQLRGEWRPMPSLLIYTRYDNQKIRTTGMQSRLHTKIDRINQKIEIRPTLNTLITVQYFRTIEKKGDYSNTTRDNPMLWIERRWNERLQTKFNFTYWREARTIGNMRENIVTLSPLAGLTYRIFNAKTGASRGEIRNDCSTSFYRRKTFYGDQSQNIYANNLSIDFYPVSILIVRGRWEITFIDQINSDTDLLNNLVELRLTAQF